MLPVVTELRILGQWVEDIGTATLLDHVLLEAGADTHLEERGQRQRGFRPALPPHSPEEAGKDKQFSAPLFSPVTHTHTHTPPTFD